MKATRTTPADPAVQTNAKDHPVCPSVRRRTLVHERRVNVRYRTDRTDVAVYPLPQRASKTRSEALGEGPGSTTLGNGQVTQVEYGVADPP